MNRFTSGFATDILRSVLTIQGAMLEFPLRLSRACNEQRFQLCERCKIVQQYGLGMCLVRRGCDKVAADSERAWNTLSISVLLAINWLAFKFLLKSDYHFNISPT